MIEIPLLKQPNQELNIVLDEQDCTIQVRQLNKFVYFTLTVDDTLIRENAICMPGVRILQGLKSFRGNFAIVDSTSPSDAQSNPDYTEFDDRYKLLYIDEAEEAELDND